MSHVYSCDLYKQILRCKLQKNVYFAKHKTLRKLEVTSNFRNVLLQHGNVLHDKFQEGSNTGNIVLNFQRNIVTRQVAAICCSYYFTF